MRNSFLAMALLLVAAPVSASTRIVDLRCEFMRTPLAIAKGVAPPGDIPVLLDNCLEDMKRHYNNHYAAGHITHQLLYDVYSDHGLIETCYDMMSDARFPSFAWMLQSGNQTIPEGPTLPQELPSRNTACQNEFQEPARWFPQTLCGVSPDRNEPAFKHVHLRPAFPLVTTTPYGSLESGWAQVSGEIAWTVRIPANSYENARFPVDSATLVKEVEATLEKSPGCELIQNNTNGIECRLGTGLYRFRFPAPTNAPSRLPESRNKSREEAK
ncbi:alpha-L-rhamnosidase C-terminal domain-containing protein [Novipirellula artificiosorum]|uniref:Bacterial alpha-L-rhamnosidase n=1 Tax=Novipirellula artificiosorum TaxID=2528016 RepID=A0A5C6DNJ2_9BACT|nr:alpha-L-rhamnosidase C-terminal domain-containing protein [Novipirellula artificiosorum]TWU37437.1 Bacterial alpha-L-rhamnosidase [Novipirellula artificiosorum]